MANKVKLSQLIEKIQNKTLTQQEAQRYFLVEPNARRPFDFNTYINPEYVDIRNLESLARDADQLVSNISAVPPGRRKTISPKRKTIHKIVAEGDSWFRLPRLWPLVPKTCIDYLQEWGYQITNFEPPRDCRRLFCLSHAATAVSATLA